MGQNAWSHGYSVQPVLRTHHPSHAKQESGCSICWCTRAALCWVRRVQSRRGCAPFVGRSCGLHRWAWGCSTGSPHPQASGCASRSVFDISFSFDSEMCNLPTVFILVGPFGFFRHVMKNVFLTAAATKARLQSCTKKGKTRQSS